MGLRFTEVGGKPVGHTHTHRDGRTTPKHNASGSIYWIRGGIKRTYAYIVKCSGVTRVNKGETAATRLICVLNLHVVFLILFICNHISLILQPKRHLLVTELVADFVLFTFIFGILYRCGFRVATGSR